MYTRPLVVLMLIRVYALPWVSARADMQLPATAAAATNTLPVQLEAQKLRAIRRLKRLAVVGVVVLVVLITLVA
jgi:hypothetical protein